MIPLVEENTCYPRNLEISSIYLFFVVFFVKLYNYNIVVFEEIYNTSSGNRNLRVRQLIFESDYLL